MTDTRIARLARRESDFRRQHSNGSDYRFGDRITHLMGGSPRESAIFPIHAYCLDVPDKEKEARETNIPPGVKGETHCKTWNVRS
jgi:hypothetical protein